MEVPCPVPLQNAWSPVGYQVVEENVSQTPIPCPAADEPLPEPCVPSSPVGYRVIEIARSQSAPQPRRTRAPNMHPPARSARPVPVRKKPPVMLWSAFAAGGGAVLVAMICLIAIRMSSAAPEPQQADAGPVVLPQVLIVAQPNVPVKRDPPPQVEAAPKLDKPARPEPPPAAPDGPVNLAGIGPPPEHNMALGAVCKVGRQNFGTSVAFARNPVEANRQADEERKLTFVLHVSGNFEEARFT